MWEIIFCPSVWYGERPFIPPSTIQKVKSGLQWIQNTLMLLLGFKVQNVGFLQSVIASFFLLLAVDTPEVEKLGALMFLNKILLGSCSWRLSLGFYVHGVFFFNQRSVFLSTVAHPLYWWFNVRPSLESLQHLILSMQKMNNSFLELWMPWFPHCNSILHSRHHVLEWKVLNLPHKCTKVEKSARPSC